MASVLIIGSNRGLGFELTLRYLDAGFQVHATTRSGEMPEAFAKAENQPRMYALDVRIQSQIDALVESLAHTPIDILIVSAGIFDREGGQGSNGPAIPEEKVFAVNTVAPMNIAEAVFPNVQASERGRMIFISSASGSRRRGPPRSVYGRSKAALNDAVRRYADEWAKSGVIGLSLHPGWVATDMGGERAQVSVEDSAAGIRWIADNMGPEHNGGFYDYQGNPVPW